MKKYFTSLFTVETEFTKKWIARFTILIFMVILFYLFLSQELLLLHISKGLSNTICKMLFENYGSVVKVCITGYAVTFIGSMIKAFMAKQQEEANKVKLQLAQEQYDEIDITEVDDTEDEEEKEDE